MTNTPSTPALRLEAAFREKYPHDSIRDWAAATETAYSSVHAYLIGTREITRRVAEKFGSRLDVTPEWLMFGTPMDRPTAEEKELLTWYRRASPEVRAATRKMLRPDPS